MESQLALFKAHRLRQGVPLSPFLFIIVMEALCRLLEIAGGGNYISGFSIGDLFANQLMISYLLFLDDALIFLGLIQSNCGN